MNDFSKSTLPREAPIGRSVYLEQRASTNRATLFALAGFLVLCVCLCVGVVGLGYYFMNQQQGTTAALNLPFLSGATPTPTRNPKPTAVPLAKSGKDDSGLRVTVVAFQRPLPAQDVKIPDGQELALVTLRIENTRATGGPVKFAPDDFKLVSAEGDSFSPDPGVITTGELLKKGEVAPGKSVKGDLIFYIYSDIQKLQLAWTSSDGTTRMFALTR